MPPKHNVRRSAVACAGAARRLFRLRDLREDLPVAAKWDATPWTPRPSMPRPTNSTSRTSSISATATSRCWRACTSRAATGPFPALVECHGGAWCLSDRTTEKIRHEAMASHGIVSVALDFRSGNEDAVSGLGAGHQLRGALGEGQRGQAQDPSRPGRPVRPVERRASRHAGRDAAARSALHRDRAAGRLAGARRHGALRDHVVAGDQSAQPLPARGARPRRRQSAGMAEVDHRAPGFLLAERSQHGRGQPDAGARARREGADAAGALVPGARRHDARLQGRGFQLRRQRAAALRRQLPQGRRRDRSRSISTGRGWPAIRRTCRRWARTSSAWSSSSAST